MDMQTVASFSTVASFLPVHMNPEDSSLLVDKIQVEANSFIVVIVQAKDSLQMVKMVQARDNTLMVMWRGQNPCLHDGDSYVLSELFSS